MSSGKIEHNYFKIAEFDSSFNESVIISENIIYKSHFSDSNLDREKIYPNFNLKHHVGRIINDHFNNIQKIHIILKNSQHLTQKQKYDYCINQRFFMKLYLKGICNRVYKKL